MPEYLITKIVTLELEFTVEADSLDQAIEYDINYDVTVECNRNDDIGHPNVSIIDEIDGVCKEITEND